MNHYPNLNAHLMAERQTFTTLDEAIDVIILEVLGDNAKNYDIEEIAHYTIASGIVNEKLVYFQLVTTEGFWAFVQLCEKTK